MSGTNNARAALEPSWMSTDNSGGGNGGGIGSQLPKSNGIEGSNGAVKTETNQPKSSGFKPKFVPKVPVKKEAAPAATTTSSTDASASGNKLDQQSSKNDNKGPRKNGNKPLMINKFTPRNKSVGFKDGPQSGARKWVMPVGAAFFTGTNAVGSSSSSSSAAVGTNAAVSTTAVPGSISNPLTTGRIARPNEKIDKHPTKVVKSASNSSFVAYMGAHESDSDAEDDDEAQQNDDDEDDEGREMWPPVEYDPLAPLALPLGPRTLTMRNQLAAEPILADPADDAAIEKEQSSSLFVLQMPTDLKLDKYQAEASSDAGASRVHIGKMQLLRSGKVQLVSTDGDIYEVNSGMASSFVQILSSIDVPGGEANSAEGKAEGGNGTATTTGAQSNSSSSRGAAAAYGVAGQPDEQSSLYLMGSITKKLVLTPCHDIGVRRPRSYSATTAANKNLPGELLHALGQPQGGRGYTDEDEMVVDA